jgi:hypothetical protein
MPPAMLTFDTLKYANTLKSSGCPPDQAEAQASALAEVFEVNLKDLASKNDLTQLEQRIVIKLGLMLAAFFSISIAALKYLPDSPPSPANKAAQEQTHRPLGG